MKLSPQNLGGAIGANEKRIVALEEQNKVLQAQIDEVKSIIENLLMRNSQYKKKQALEGVDDFLRNRFGRT